MATSIFKLATFNWVSMPGPSITIPNAPTLHQWLLILTGVAYIDDEGGDGFKGTSTAAWRRESFDLNLDLTAPLQAAGRSPTSPNLLAFSVSQWAPFATINSVYDQHQAVDAGF